MTRNTQYKNEDLDLWNKYKQTQQPQYKHELLKRFDPLIYSQVNKWGSVVPKDVLRNEAKVLAAKSFDTYDPNKGTALATHVTNNLAPISRIVYKHQNTARLPENITLKMNSYLAANDHLTSTLGREPTTDELRDELGWTAAEINRVQSYNRNDLVESAGPASGSFYSTRDDDDEDLIAAVFYDLLPNEKKLFEYTTGYNGKEKLPNDEIMKRMGLSQAQLSYQKTLLTNKINRLLG